MWHTAEACLYHVDIKGRQLIRTDIDNGDQQIWDMPGFPGSIAALASAGVLVALPNGIFVFDPKTERLRLWQAVDFLPPGWRFNDATVDPNGRWFIGTCRHDPPRPHADGALWVIDSCGPPRKLVHGFRLLNGLAFSASGRTLHLSDSSPETQQVWRYAYDPETGDLGAHQLVLDMRLIDGRPDGAAFDADGNYWLAAVGSGDLIKLSPDGERLSRVSVGTALVTKPAFVGSRLDRLIVTTAGSSGIDLLGGGLIELAADAIGLPIPAIVAS